jgi:HD-GYP domain-containing protein (c-di-GMP phosphodiesterase class II)
MEQELAAAQTLRYAEELRDLWSEERAQRGRAEDALSELEQTYAATVRALATALELRDYGTGNHAERVTRLALRLAREAAPGLADDRELEYGFLLHDVGKIGIPDAILLKPGPLTREERAEMEQHPYLGERIVARIPHLRGLSRQVIASHHERWDGTGYPRGQAGAEIPYAARIFALADAFDAMTNDRPYRAALPVAEALRRMEACGGTQFDPELAAIFVELAVGSEEAA